MVSDIALVLISIWTLFYFSFHFLMFSPFLRASPLSQLHAANVGIQTEKFENLRISIAKGSPMWETLDRCIDVVDSQSVELLVPRVAQLVRAGVGLNTRYFASPKCNLHEKCNLIGF